VFDTTCGQQLNHAILAVGYASNYYIVKNSWGTSWGASGYIYIVRGKNMCGIAKEPSYAT
jgi:cathepsin L